MASRSSWRSWPVPRASEGGGIPGDGQWLFFHICYQDWLCPVAATGYLTRRMLAAAALTCGCLALWESFQYTRQETCLCSVGMFSILQQVPWAMLYKFHLCCPWAGRKCSSGVGWHIRVLVPGGVKKEDLRTRGSRKPLGINLLTSCVCQTTVVIYPRITS